MFCCTFCNIMVLHLVPYGIRLSPVRDQFFYSSVGLRSPIPYGWYKSSPHLCPGAWFLSEELILPIVLAETTSLVFSLDQYRVFWLSFPRQLPPLLGPISHVLFLLGREDYGPSKPLVQHPLDPLVAGCTLVAVN